MSNLRCNNFLWDDPDNDPCLIQDLKEINAPLILVSSSLHDFSREKNLSSRMTGVNSLFPNVLQCLLSLI